jgi:hypothetical protein
MQQHSQIALRHANSDPVEANLHSYPGLNVIGIFPHQANSRVLDADPGSSVTHIETGQKHVALLELIEWAEAIGFDPEEAIERISKLTSK